MEASAALSNVGQGVGGTSKKLFIKTYGCQSNVYDSQKMSELLRTHGFSNTGNIEEADLVIYNTCHIREKASEKVFSELGKAKIIKDRRKSKGLDTAIVVAGCTAQAEGEEIVRRAPYVDVVVGPQANHTLPTLIEQVRREKRWVMNLDMLANEKFDNLPVGNEKDVQDPSVRKYSAFLAIQEGCDKFCHFCCVPYTRGAEFSRPAHDVFKEAIALVKAGAKEITLLGQNVSAYHGSWHGGSQYSIGQLIRLLCTIDGLERVRYMTSHPKDMTDDELFLVHEHEEKVMPYLFLPVQSGSDKVLKLMNRRHTAEFYLGIIENFRKARPNIAFSSDFIVGYPGETEEDFLQTMELVMKVEYAQCFSFKYSPRPGTPGALIEKQIEEDVKQDRLARLQELLRTQQLDFNRNTVGKTVPVLFEKQGKIPGQITGKTPYMQTVCVAGSEKSTLGQTLNVNITGASQNTLIGNLV